MVELNLEFLLEALYALGGRDEVSTEELVRYLGVEESSVSKLVEKLLSMGFLESIDGKRMVRLTEMGFRAALDANYRSGVIKRFMVDFLCIPDLTADEDTHRMMTALSDETLRKMVTFLEFVEEAPVEFQSWFSKFRNMVCPLV